jgi:sulfite oxidase
VLALAGLSSGAVHVGFAGADISEDAEPAQRFGGSIPLDKARRPEVLLAWAMNGEPLPTCGSGPPLLSPPIRYET